MVGKFNADFYYLNGLTLESRKRREHLSEEDLQKNKAIVESFTKGGGTHSFDEVSYLYTWRHFMDWKAVKKKDSFTLLNHLYSNSVIKC